MATLPLKSSHKEQHSAIRLLWTPCCFDNRSNDRSGQFPHAVKPACDGINVYMNMDDRLNKKLSYRREAVRCLVLLSILVSR